MKITMLLPLLSRPSDDSKRGCAPQANKGGALPYLFILKLPLNREHCALRKLSYNSIQYQRLPMYSINVINLFEL